ncbi:MAG: MBL fold metallo-hydrolase [Polyangiales bacterium]
MKPVHRTLVRASLLASLVAAGLACSGGGTPAASSPPTTTGATPAETANPPSDVFKTSAGDVALTPIHHATMLLTFGGKNIYLDPWSEGDLGGYPKADAILITDIHPDHYDPKALELLRTPSTIVVAPPVVAEKLPGVQTLKNGETTEVLGMKVEAIPMYNLQRGPEAGKLFHDKGRGNGYVLTFGDKRMYVSGDTECTDEMKALKNIDVAFVCMNLPYTMTPGEAAGCVNAFKPKVVFPYHHRDSKLEEFSSAIPKDSGVEVRVRRWY